MILIWRSRQVVRQVCHRRFGHLLLRDAIGNPAHDSYTLSSISAPSGCVLHALYRPEAQLRSAMIYSYVGMAVFLVLIYFSYATSSPSLP
jgi:hypothetical protein